jgi:hypothetical protein
MSEHRGRHIDVHPADEAALAKLINDTDMLAGLVIEMFEDKPTTLLSPVFRQMILDHAKGLKYRHDRLKAHLCIDNPSKPLLESHRP